MPRDHFVMRCHLEKFVHPSSAISRLYPYRKGKGLVPYQRKGVGPKGLGWAEDFYSQILPDGSTSRKLDKGLLCSEQTFFGCARDHLGTLARCVVDPEFFPRNEHDRMNIVYCASFTHCRAPVQIHNAAMMRQLGATVDLFNSLNPESDQAATRVMRSESLSREEATRLLNKLQGEVYRGDLSLSVGPTLERQDGFNLLSDQDQLWVMIQMKWLLLEAAPGSFFITSDNPVVLENSHLRHKKLLGIRLPRTVVWYPISYRYGFLMGWTTNRAEGRSVAGHSRTRMLNRWVIKRAYQHVYSPLRDDWIDDAVKRETFSPLLGRLKSLKDLCESATGDVADLLSALENGEPADVFEGCRLH